MLKELFEKRWMGYVLAFVGTAAATGALKVFGGHVNSTTVALVLLLVVLFVAALWGQDAPYEFSFIVRALDEKEHSVAVRFSNETVALVARRRRIPLAPISSFWINCAEHCLATYLAEKNHLPPGVELIIEELCLAELEAARLWGDDSDLLLYLSTG